MTNNYKRELEEYIRDYKRDLQILENIKRVKRKNGKDFKNLMQNFTDSRGYYKLLIEKNFINFSTLKVGGITVKILNNKMLENITADDIEKLIKERIVSLRENIKDTENKIKKIDTIDADIEKIRNDIKKISEKYEISEYRIIEIL